MDFFEQIFHMSPDGGDGVVEVVIILGFIVASILAILHKTSQPTMIQRTSPRGAAWHGKVEASAPPVAFAPYVRQ